MKPSARENGYSLSFSGTPYQAKGNIVLQLRRRVKKTQSDVVLGNHDDNTNSTHDTIHLLISSNTQVEEEKTFKQKTH